MATAKDFPVTFGYLEKWGTYTHRGEDRAMDTGTPVIVGGTQIGLSGNTGKSTGPHLHLQCGKDKYAQTTIKPSNYWFKGDTVVETGTASEWGNYVIVKYLDVYCVYAHLSKITVKAGQKLGDNMISDKHKYLLRIVNSEVKGWNRSKVHSGEYDERELSAWRGKDVTTFTQQAWNEGAKYRKDKDAWLEAYRQLPNLEAAIAEKDKILAQIKAEAETAQGKLKADIEAANTKILELTAKYEQAQEDLEEANQVDEKQVVENWLKKLWNKLFN